MINFIDVYESVGYKPINTISVLNRFIASLDIQTDAILDGSNMTGYEMRDWPMITLPEVEEFAHFLCLTESIYSILSEVNQYGF